MAFVNGSVGRIVEMNITPLVDVMLVMLVIFMITMPPRTYPIGVDLPRATPKPPPAQTIALKIAADGAITWNDCVVPLAALSGAMRVEAERYADPAQQPVIAIDADQNARYEVLADVLADARNAGLVKIGFVGAASR
jgi:biopolymer transport protein ExbD